MTDQDQKQLKFTIRRLTPEEEQPSSGKAKKTPVGKKTGKPRDKTAVSKTKPKKEEVQPPVPSSSGLTGGCFSSAGSVLAFLGSALGTGLADEAAVRRVPEGGWWAEVPVSSDRIASLVWTAKGSPYGRKDSQWVALTISGEFPTGDQERQTLDVEPWPVTELAELLSETSLMPGRYIGTQELGVLVPGSLGRWVLRRALALGLGVSIMPVLQRPLGNNRGKETGALLFRLEPKEERGNIPAALVHSLTALPYVTVADSHGCDNILVDVRCRVPLPPSILSGMVPGKEIWVLGPPDTGYWRLRTAGEEVDGATLLNAPEISITDVFPSTVANLPEPIPVQLVPRPGAGKRVDAVLLDESELAWLRPFLRGRPLGEVSFLLPGSGCYLLTAPGGLPGGGAPFGVPLVRVGPGGLFIEMGMDFYPPLPDSARQKRFKLDPDSAVVVVRDAAYRFSIKDMVPAWTLWVGEAPEVREGLSKNSKRVLSQISELIRQAEAKQEMPRQKESKPVSRSERISLLEQAQLAELAGELVLAAESLEKAGYPGPAGRLYERATRKD